MPSTPPSPADLARSDRLEAGNPPKLYTRFFAVAFVSQLFLVLANTLMSHYARWVEFLGGDVQDVGWVMGGGAVFGFLLRPWMGQWINRLGASTMWFAGLALFEIGVIGNLWVHQLTWMVYALRASTFLGASLVFTSSLTYITQIAPPQRRTEAIGAFGAAGFVGMVAGPFLGDWLLGVPQDRTRGDFYGLFVLGGVAVALAIVLLLLAGKMSMPRPSRSVRLVDFIRLTRRHWPGAIVAVNVTFGLCLTLPFMFLPSYIDAADIRLGALSSFGAFFFVYGGWGLFVRLLTRRLGDQVGRRKVLLAGMAFYTSGIFCFSLADSVHPWLLLLPGVLCGTGHALSFPTINALALERFPPEVRGTGSAFSLMAIDVGAVGGAPILGAIADVYSFHMMFAVVGTLGVLSIVYYTWATVPVWRARRAQREVSAPEVSLPHTDSPHERLRERHSEVVDATDASA